MIIEGQRAGNVGFWSWHLLRTDTNERAKVTETRGVVASDLKGALREMQAVASGSQCGPDFLYQANLNPRAHETLTPEQWRRSIDKLEERLGFTGHARVVVEHVKNGRQHFHVIWTRIDDDLKTVSPFYNFKAHKDVARELEIEFGQERTPEIRQGPSRAQLWEHERAAASGIAISAVTAELTQLWRQADNGRSFAAAVAERGYVLARGDRRDFVIVDQAGTPHSLARRLEGAKAAGVRQVMSDVDRAALPSVAEARAVQIGRYPEPGRAWESRPALVSAEADDPDETRRRTQGEKGPRWSENQGRVAQEASAVRYLEKQAERSRRATSERLTLAHRFDARHRQLGQAAEKEGAMQPPGHRATLAQRLDARASKTPRNAAVERDSGKERDGPETGPD